MFKRNVLQKLKWRLRDLHIILLVMMMAAPHPSMGLLGKSKKKKAKEKAERALQEEEAAQAKAQEEASAQESQPEPERERPRQSYSNEYERDRAAIIRIRKRLEDMFLGNSHVFPDEDNEGARIYIDALLSIPEDFILRGKRPTGWVELPVAGPSATMKTLIFKVVSDYLERAGLLDPQKKYFHQAEAGYEIDPNFLIGLGVSDSVVKKFVGADPVQGYTDSSTYSQDKHEVYLKMFAMVGQDESTHRDHLPDTIEEAYEMAFKKVAEQYGELDEEAKDKMAARVQEPQKPEDESNQAAMKKWRSDMIAWEMQRLKDTKERKADSMSFEDAIKQARYDVEMRWEARDKMIAFAKRHWQATSGGTVREAKFIPINPALKKELQDLEEEIAKLKTKFLEIGQMANSDVLQQQVELVPKLKSENEATQRAMEQKSQDVEIYDLQEGLFSELTPYQVYSWLRKNDHLAAFDMNDFDPSSQSSDAAMIRQLIEDLTQYPEEFISEGASLAKRVKNYSQLWKVARKVSIWRSGRALRSRVANAGDESEETPAAKGIKDVKDREMKRHEKKVNIDWEDGHIRKVKEKMDKAVADYTRKMKGTMLADVSRARQKIADNKTRISEIEEQARNLQELIDHTAAEAEKKKKELEEARARGEDVEELRILTSQDALSELERLEEKMHILLMRAAKSESVQQAIRAEIMGLNAADLRNKYPDHYTWLTKVMQANPNDYLHNLKASNDIDLMTEQLYRMSPSRFKSLTVSMMKDGGVETTSTHFGLIKVDLMNVREIEDEVNECMKGRDKTWADYAGCYEETLAKPEHKEWVLRYHKEFNKQFVDQGTPNAALRRLQGKRGAIFLLPPGPKRVANQAARALLFDFNEMQEQLRNNSIREMDLKLHVDKNIALALVKRTDNATLGLDPVLERVKGIWASLNAKLEPQLQAMRESNSELNGHLALTLEQSTSPNGGIVIALRWLPSNMDDSPLADAAVFDPQDPNMKFNELELPKGNLVAEYPLNIKPEDMYFLQPEETLREWTVTNPDGTLYKRVKENPDPTRMDPNHPGLIQVLSKSFFMDRINTRIGRTQAESDAMAEARAEEAKERQRRIEEDREQMDFIVGESRDSNIPKKVDIYGDLPKIPSKASKFWKYGKWLGGPVTAIWVGIGKLVKGKMSDEDRREMRRQEQRLRLMYEARDIWFKIHFPNGVLGPKAFYSGTEPDDEFYHYYLAQKRFRTWVKQPGVTPDDLEEYYKSWNEYVDRYNAYVRSRRLVERTAETARSDGKEESEIEQILEGIPATPEMVDPCVGLMSGKD